MNFAQKGFPLHLALRSSSVARQQRNKRRVLRHKLKLAALAALQCSSQTGEQRSKPVSLNVADKTSAGTSVADAFCATVRGYLAVSNLNVATYWRDWVSADSRSPKSRVRDLVPLPRMVAWPSEVDVGTLKMETCLHTTNVCVAALNCLHQGKPFADVHAASQQQNHQQLRKHRVSAEAFHTAAPAQLKPRIPDAFLSSPQENLQLDGTKGKWSANPQFEMPGPAQSR